MRVVAAARPRPAPRRCTAWWHRTPGPQTVPGSLRPLLWNHHCRAARSARRSRVMLLLRRRTSTAWCRRHLPIRLPPARHQRRRRLPLRHPWRSSRPLQRALRWKQLAVAACRLLTLRATWICRTATPTMGTHHLGPCQMAPGPGRSGSEHRLIDGTAVHESPPGPCSLTFARIQIPTHHLVH